MKKAKKEEKNIPAEKQILALTDQLKRVAAEFENYRKRVEKEICERQKYASEEMIRKILPLFNNLELAVKNSDKHEELVKGVKLIHEQMRELLEREGVKKIECTGKEFDPNLHEALMQEESEKDNIVLKEFQPGYKMKDKVLLHSKVKVGKNESHEEKTKESDNQEHEKGDSTGAE